MPLSPNTARDSVVLVELELPRSVYERLRLTSINRGESVTEMLTTDAYRMSRLDPESDEPFWLWSRRFTDAQIAAELGWTNARVSRWRNKNNLERNRRPSQKEKSSRSMK